MACSGVRVPPSTVLSSQLQSQMCKLLCQDSIGSQVLPVGPYIQKAQPGIGLGVCYLALDEGINEIPCTRCRLERAHNILRCPSRLHGSNEFPSSGGG